MNDMIVEVVHPQAGQTLIPGVAVHFSETPGAIRRPAPVLGQHNDEVLTELGYTCEEIEGLRVAGVI
jgi:CoA:oxalate CoA-transferase